MKWLMTIILKMMTDDDDPTIYMLTCKWWLFCWYLTIPCIEAFYSTIPNLLLLTWLFYCIWFIYWPVYPLLRRLPAFEFNAYLLPRSFHALWVYSACVTDSLPYRWFRSCLSPGLCGVAVSPRYWYTAPVPVLTNASALFPTWITAISRLTFCHCTMVVGLPFFLDYY